VCCESFDAQKLPKTLCSCTHGSDVCMACHVKYLTATTELIGGVRCMTRQCEAKYEVTALDALLGVMASRTLRDRIDDATFLARPGAMLCTRAGCRGHVMAPARESVSRSATCLKCAYVVCVDCMLEGHDDFVTCAEYAASRPTDGVSVTTEQFLNLITKKCPSCHLRIVKNGGCPHMACTRCSFQFCFGCLRARGSHVPPGEHVDCQRLSSEFETNANRKMAELRNVTQVLAKRRAMEERRARQEARAAHHAATRRQPMVDVVVLPDFFDDDAPFATLAPTATVAVVTRVAVPIGGGAVRVRAAAIRRTLAMSV